MTPSPDVTPSVAYGDALVVVQRETPTIDEEEKIIKNFSFFPPSKRHSNVQSINGLVPFS